MSRGERRAAASNLPGGRQRSGMTARAVRCASQAGRVPVVPGRPAAGWPGRLMGRYRTSRPAVSERLVCPGRRVLPLRLRSPSKSARAHRLWVAVLSRSRRQITTGLTHDKRSAHLSSLAARCVDNSGFLRMHRVRLALFQVNALSWVHPGRGIPSISTGYAQVRRRCAQVIHMLVHRQQGSRLLTRSRSARRCSPARAKHARTRGPRPGGQMRSPQRAGIPMPGTGRGPRRPRYAHAALAGPLVTSSLRCRSRKLEIDTLVPSPGISAADRRPATAESGKAPPCMRWRGLARPRRAKPASCLASLAPPARRCQTPARGTGLPAPPTFPGVYPEVVPVSNGESISTASVSARARPRGQ